METPQFCGATCHSMHPEFAAYRNSPHSRVECVECRVAPGAAGWVSSKAAGTRQLIETVFNTYRRPIPSLPGSIISFYQKSYADVYGERSQDIHQAAQAILAIYNRNVFPDFKVTWGTYPNNLGHTDFPGLHATADNASITQDCNTCHEPLAIEEASPEILKSLGIVERISNVQKQ